MQACGLCGALSSLKNSHILPSFVFDWLKRSSATGHIRLGTAPNKRVQDGMKMLLLCENCEQRFSTSEKEFSEHVFAPLHDPTVYEGGGPSTASPIAYGSWLLQFAVSVSWRSLTFIQRSRGLSGHFPQHLEAALCLAESNWRKFLLGDRPHPGRFEQHMLCVGPIESSSIDLPPNMNRYLLRAPEIDIVCKPNSAFIYSKLCRAIVIGVIEMPGAKKWRGTKIHANAGRLPDQNPFIDQAVIDYMISRARRLQELEQSISPRQRSKIESDFARNHERAIGSDTLRSRLADIELSERKGSD